MNSDCLRHRPDGITAEYRWFIIRSHRLRRLPMAKLKAFRDGALIAYFLCLCVPTTFAQAYPTKSIRLIVGTSAGGGGDVIGRIVAGGLNQILGQQVIVDNRPGAGGNIAPET